MTAPVAQRRSVEVGVALWVALWLVVGVWTGVEVWQLSQLTQTVADSGRALDEAGMALQSLSSIPVVGGEAADLGTQVRQNGVDIVASAADAQGSFRRLAVLLGVTIAFVPTVPVVAMHRVLRRLPTRQA
jgi:hypothetical protein